MEDSRLLQGFRAGSRTDFASLVERHAREVYPFLVRVSGLEAAERLTQDVFAAAWRDAASYHSDRPVRLWLFSLAVKAAGSREGFDGRWEAATRVELGRSPQPAEAAGRPTSEDLGGVVALAVSELPFPQRVVLVLKTYRDFGIADLSATLDAPGDVVAALLAAAFNSFINRLRMRAAR